jgi:phosphoadenosine phosphosulfate reductase
LTKAKYDYTPLAIRIIESLDCLQANEPPEGYHLAFSGGKDSICVKRLADMAQVRYTAHFNMTTIDQPEIMRFIRRHHPDVIWDRPKVNFIRHVGTVKPIPPTRLMRHCCAAFKERVVPRCVLLTGIRAQESPRRAKRGQVEDGHDEKVGARKFVHPIFNWHESHVWEFIDHQMLPYPSLYDEDGIDRIGCLCCGLKTPRQRLADLKRWPHAFWIYETAFSFMLKTRRERGLTTTWQTTTDVWVWWLEGKATAEDINRIRRESGRKKP